MRKRSHRVVFYLDDEEFSAFIEKVKRTSLSREGFIRNMLAGVVIKERPPADVPYLLREIRRIGNNINQILRIANANGFIDTPRLRSALDELSQANQLIYRTYAKER